MSKNIIVSESFPFKDEFVQETFLSKLDNVEFEYHTSTRFCRINNSKSKKTSATVSTQPKNRTYDSSYSLDF